MPVRPHPIVNINGIFYGEKATNAVSSSVPATIEPILILSGNSERKGAILVNDSSNSLFLKFGIAGSVTDYSTKLYKRAYYEVPIPIFTGPLYGVWDGVDGSVKLTEFI